jgi:hypothetical protein
MIHNKTSLQAKAKKEQRPLEGTTAACIPMENFAYMLFKFSLKKYHTIIETWHFIKP